MTIFVTTDPHLFHPLVDKIRGFDTVEEYNEAWMDSMSVVKKNDQLHILGDLTGGGHLYEATNLVGMLPCELHLILGNHDPGHPMFKDSHRKLGAYKETFTSVQTAATKTAMGHRFLFSHFPYAGDHTTSDRFAQWRLPDLGTALIHGHTHQELVLTHTPHGTPQIHAGWDTWHEPVPMETLALYV